MILNFIHLEKKFLIYIENVLRKHLNNLHIFYMLVMYTNTL